MGVKYLVGQRYISMMEPELGIGIITKSEFDKVVISFSTSNISRQYKVLNAPIKRMIFSVGDKIKCNTSGEIVVTGVEDDNGLIIYHCNDVKVAECDLSDFMGFNSPVERMKNGISDHTDLFDLRYKALIFRNRIMQSPVTGFVGGRIDMIPHQVFIANEIANRVLPRALLSDEVGLGKTIEALMIIHRLLRTERINRVLIIVPQSLIYQWFAELLHRFNLAFRVIDKRFVDSFLSKNENPFSDGTLCLTSINILTANESIKKSVIQSGWDLVLVDEAHNIKEDTEEYSLLEKLSKATLRLLLLTATPEQLGLKGHFARLKLLDPKKYCDYKTFLLETENYRTIAGIAGDILDRKTIDKKRLSGISDDFYNFLEDKKVVDIKNGDQESVTQIINEIIDRHGVGRVSFRNTRRTVKGFPKRLPILVPISDCSSIEYDAHMEVYHEFHYENRLASKKPVYKYHDDPRVAFVAKLLTDFPEQKYLLICRSKEKVFAINEALKRKDNFIISIFHEDMKMIERDKNAAWFAAPEGAQILLCSEIGSEGRNFQFTNNLVLFDLPLDPEILEQRVGRLDRIGQNKEVNIYVPYVKGSVDEVLVSWYHNGLNAFECNIQDGGIIYERFVDDIKHIAADKNCFDNAEKLNGLLEITRENHHENIKILDAGRDRLLEINSFNKDHADKILDLISHEDTDCELEDFMQEIFSHYGINDEPIGNRTYLLTPGNVKTDAFPKIDDDGVCVTYDRKIALKNENILFLNIDHPYITRSIDLLLGSEEGTSTTAVWFSDEAQDVFIEIIFVVECVAPVELYVSRFLPVTPIRILINSKCVEYTDEYSKEFLESVLKYDREAAGELLNNSALMDRFIPEMVCAGEKAACEKVDSIIKNALKRMNSSLGYEISRLKYLKSVNSSVRDDEIETAVNELSSLTGYIEHARSRIDTVRLIWRKCIK